MWIIVASNRSRKFRSITGRITEIDKQVGEITRISQSVTDGLGSDAVSSDAILSGAVGSDALESQSITADKIAPSVFETASSGVQRVPAPLTSINYWNSAIYGNITAFSEAYFADKENKNVSVSALGITFSPEKNSHVIASTAELQNGGLVMLETRTAHGYEIGDYIRVTNLGSPIDGEWVITDVPTATSISYNINQFEEATTNLDFNYGAYVDVGGNETDGSSYRQSIVKKSFINGVATITLFDRTDSNPDTASSHGYTAGYVIDVIGLGSPYDGTQVITAIPDGELNSLQYRPDEGTIPEFTPRIALASGWGDGNSIVYSTIQDATATDIFHGLSVNQHVEITGFTTNTGYNISGQVSGVFGSGTSFTLPSTVIPAVDAPETGGTYYCYNGEIKAEADAVLFLTGVNPVPVSRNVVISWVADKPIDFRIVLWDSDEPDAPKFLMVDADTTESISRVFGLNTYIWEVPEGIFQYAVYAEVLSGKEDVLLKECYVFESVGDSAKKVEKITGAYVDAVANNTNKITFFTSSPHSHEINDYVKISGVDIISSAASQEFQVQSISEDKRSFTILAPVVDIKVSTVSGSNVVTTLGTLDPISNTVINQNISGLISVGQPYTSSNTTALPNGTVTQILRSTLLSNTRTNLSATLVANSNTVTLTTGNTEGITAGQQVTKVSGTGVFGNTGTVFVTSVPNSTAFIVSSAHNTSGATIFNTALPFLNHDSFSVANNSGATNSSVVLSFYLPQTGSTPAKTGLVANLTAGSNAVTLTTGNTDADFSVGQLLTKSSGTGAFGNTGAVFVTSVDSSTTFTVDANHETSGSITFGTTAQNSAIALRASSIGGYKKNESATLSPGGLSIKSLGQSINLTDQPTDNYIAVTTADSGTVASISNTGTGTFKSLNANSLSVEGDITIGNENTALVGTFIDEKFNGRPYGGALLDRLARGTIYQAYWLTPSSPIENLYHGFAAGTFKLDTNRLYQIYVSSAGMRASVSTNVALEFLISTTPIRLENDTDLSHLSYTHPSQTYTTSTPNNSTFTTGTPSDSTKTTAIGNDSVFTTTSNSGHTHAVNVTHTHNVNISHTHTVTASHTHTVNVFNSSFWRDLVGHFYSTSPTPVADNTTKYAITSFSRSEGNANVVITLPNVAAKYIEAYDDLANMFFGVNFNTSLYEENGTYKLIKINRTQFRFTSIDTAAISTTQRVQNLQATLVAGSNSITLTSGVTTNISVGQRLIKTSGTGAFGNGGIVYVKTKGTGTLTVADFNNTNVAHSVSGAITFEASAGEINLVDPIMTNTSLSFSNATINASGTISAGSNTITGLDSTANIAVGDTIYRTAGAALSNTTVTSIVNTTAITVAATSGASGVTYFETNYVLATSDGTNHTYFIPNLFQAGQLIDVYSGYGADNWTLVAGTVVSANSTQFIVKPRSNAIANGGSITTYIDAYWSDRQVQLHRNYLPSETDLYYVLRLRHQALPNSYSITLAENPNSMLAITDLGQAKDMDFVAQGEYGGAISWTSGLPIGFSDLYSTVTTRLTETQILPASDSAYYDNYGKGTGTDIPYSYLYNLYQGNLGDANGTKKSAVLFPAFDFTDKTDGLVIVKLEVYLRNRHSYNSDGLTAYLAVHEGTSLGSSVPLAKDSCPAITTTFTKGQGKWITLPTSWHDAFTNGGTGRGILLGVTDENPDTYYNEFANYGYFDGITLEDAPQIRVTFEYNSPVGSQNSIGGDGSDGFYDYLDYRYN
jgi:hypothetical protein